MKKRKKERWYFYRIPFDAMVLGLQIQSSSSPHSLHSKKLFLNLYVGHFLARWSARLWPFFFFFSFPNFLFSQYLVVFGHFWWTIMSFDVKPLGFRCSSIFVSTRLKKLGCLDFTCLIIYWFVWRNHRMGCISSVDTTCLTEIGKLWNFKKISIRNLCPLPLLGQDFFNGSLIKLVLMERMRNEVKNSFFFFILSSGFGVNKDY